MTNSIVTAILGVFEEVAQWFADTMPIIMQMFYNEGSLTVLGTVVIISLAVAVALLLVNIIKSFVQFR